MRQQNPKTALVTGATRGLGLEIARSLAQAGCTVYLTGRKLAEATEAAKAGVEGSGALIPLQLDVGDDASIARAAAEVASKSSALDVLVNNAGTIQPIGRTASVSPSAWRRNIEVNLVGSMACFSAFWPVLEKSREPTLVNISSGAASSYREGWSAYCVAKAGLSMLSQALATEYGAWGLRVFSLRPGLVDTGMQAEIRTSGVNDISRVPRENLLPATLPAALVTWLLQNRPADLSGVEIDIRDPAIRERTGIRFLGDPAFPSSNERSADE
jgi:NAD(P)-dependent dehydrogenase (short-subunit alcohol dehydrogenase family)